MSKHGYRKKLELRLKLKFKSSNQQSDWCLSKLDFWG